MIFVTVGTQEPFDRFLRIIDKLAGQIDEELIVQAFHDKYEPENFKVRDLIPPDEFDRIFKKARLIVAHAGMGTIISAMESGKPVVVFPRQASLGEHRTDHQMATAHQMQQLGYAYVAYTEDELIQYVLDGNLKPLHSIGNGASESLIRSLREFIG